MLGKYPMLFHPNSCAGGTHNVLGSEETIKTNHVLGVEYHQEWFGGGVGGRDRTRSFHGISCFYFHRRGDDWTCSPTGKARTTKQSLYNNSFQIPDSRQCSFLTPLRRETSEVSPMGMFSFLSGGIFWTTVQTQA